jgi:hypothetical protein
MAETYMVWYVSKANKHPPTTHHYLLLVHHASFPPSLPLTHIVALLIRPRPFPLHPLHQHEEGGLGLRVPSVQGVLAGTVAQG